MDSLKVDTEKHKFREGDTCPFCDGVLHDMDGKFTCSDKACLFNKLTLLD